MDRDYFEDHHKEDISLSKLIKYNLLFVVPIAVSMLLSIFLGRYFGRFLGVMPITAAKIIMMPFTLLIFMFLIPYIRDRENVKGVRLALVDFLIIGVFITVPRMFIGDFSMFLLQFVYLAGYVLLTFVYCPEVLGIDVDLRRWFRRKKQLFILLIYASIALFYIMGFAQIYSDIYKDPVSSNDFNFEGKETPKYGMFLYYSLVSFATVGYGDITPASSAARLVFGIEAVIAMIVNVVFIAILFLYVSNTQSILRAEQIEMKRMKVLEKKEKEILRLEKRQSAQLSRMRRKKSGKRKSRR